MNVKHIFIKVKHIFIKVKQAGKRKLLLNNQSIEISLIDKPTVRDFIHAMVEQQVNAFNAKDIDTHLFHALSFHEIEDQASSGKVGFGAINNEKKQI